jgi:hypothetical protein
MALRGSLTPPRRSERQQRSNEAAKRQQCMVGDMAVDFAVDMNEMKEIKKEQREIV